jgi:hypothetical protein
VLLISLQRWSRSNVETASNADPGTRYNNSESADDRLAYAGARSRSLEWLTVSDREGRSPAAAAIHTSSIFFIVHPF